MLLPTFPRLLLLLPTLAPLLHPVSSANPTTRTPTDPRNIAAGSIINSEYGYYDQPQVVPLLNGTWVVLLTSGPDREGQASENVYATVSHDRGRTWAPRMWPIHPPHPYGPPAAWVNPVYDPRQTAAYRGPPARPPRLFAYYTFNSHNITHLPNASAHSPPMRADCLGEQVFRVSDDLGLTWSVLPQSSFTRALPPPTLQTATCTNTPHRSEALPIPIDTKAIDRNNEFGGKVHEGWSVGKFVLSPAAGADPSPPAPTVVMQFAKRQCQNLGSCFASKAQHLDYVPMQSFAVASPNMLTEPDPQRIVFETWPRSDTGLQTLNTQLAEEGGLVPLGGAGSLYYAIRSFDGFVGVATYNHTTGLWRDRQRAVYAGQPNRFLKNPNGPLAIRRFPVTNTTDGYLLVFYNRGMPADARGLQVASWGLRNPYFLAGGALQPDGSLAWSQPEVLLYALDSTSRIGYPDLFQDPGTGRLHITETNKIVPRVHAIDPALVAGLWAQLGLGPSLALPTGAVLNLTCPAGPTVPAPPLWPAFATNSGSSSSAASAATPQAVTIDLWLASLPTAAGSVLDCTATTSGGSGFQLSYTAANRTFRMELVDTHHGRASLDSDPLPAAPAGAVHVAFVVDGPANMVLSAVNGSLGDGAAAQQQGFFFAPVSALGAFVGGQTCRILNGGSFAADLDLRMEAGASSPASAAITSLRVWSRALRTSELVALARAGPGRVCREVNE